MALQISRKQVLTCFKKIHRTRMAVFKDDVSALQAARLKINEEFKKHKRVKDEIAIQELMRHSEAVEIEMRTSIVQAYEVKPGTYEVRISPDTNKLDNVPYKDCSR